MKRRFPRPKDLAPLLRFKSFDFNSKRRRLESALTLYDLREIAKRRTPTAPFDYTDGSAEGEVSIRRAREAFEDVQFTPNILRNVADADTSIEVLGKTSSMPTSIAPTGFTRMMHSAGEQAGSKAAGQHGIPFTLSTLGTETVETVAEANPNGRNWFQLYMLTDRELSMGLVERAANAGYDTLFVTVDVPVAGARLRDKRNGMTIPPTLTPKTIVNAIPRPEWWINFLTTEPLEFANLRHFQGTVGELIDTMFDPTITFDDLKWIRDQWKGNLVVKGIQSLQDAKSVADYGVEGIVLSNHGGRQLDKAPVPFHLLPEVHKHMKGKYEIMVDTGIMNGADIAAAVALGANSTMIGRAYLYGLMAGGQEGVEKTLEILRDQLVRTMKLLGVNSVQELEPRHVQQLKRYEAVKFD